MINAMKNFLIGLEGPDELSNWWIETLRQMLIVGAKYGTDVGNGVKRYTSNTNGGPVFVYVKDGKIIRITPIEFDNKDAKSWTIKARGKAFTPPRKTTVSPHTLAFKSMIYSPDRILYPMKRVDFDPKGERNCQNRGISGYERISWDEALDIVSDEIKRVKREYGPGSIMNGSGSHHMWGTLGYWLSARNRFFNSIGFTPIAHNPDSWEGWHWGAMHHWGNSMRLGASETYGTVKDLLKECEMVVFWSSDPESTSGVYGAFEGTLRRQWLKDLGIKLVHIDPYYNHTAALFGGKWLAPRPATGNALALAIAYVWITEDLYDKEYVATRTTGFDQWKDYILGKEDGIPKTPEWQENESAVPAKDVRALAREWGSKKTYLAAGGIVGFGSACRCATGTEWARSMVCLMAMQGLGKPGVNMGCLQQGTPVDTSFYFPGYSEGGLSGDRETATAQAAAECLRRVGVERVTGDRTLPLIFAEVIRQSGIQVECDLDMGVLERRSKDEEEIAWIREAQRVTEAAVQMACELIARAEAGKDGVLLHEGEILTSERVRTIVDIWFLEREYSNPTSIIAGGQQGADCHNVGSGALKTVGKYFLGQRVPVSRGAVFDDIGNKDLLAPQSDGRQQLLEELSGWPDEGTPLLVFVPAWRFADEHYFGVFGTFTGHDIGAVFG